MQATLAQEDLTARVNKVIKDVLKVDEGRIKMDSRFKEDLGADSLDCITLLMALEEEFQIIIPESDAEKFIRIADAYNYLPNQAIAV